MADGEMYKGFEAMDRRCRLTDARFKKMDKSFSSIGWAMLIGFTLVSLLFITLKFRNK